jgi:hypothetical protein
MIPPPDFRFSQGSLQDFVDCKHRFLLRYMKRLAWPAIVTEPVIEHERRMYLGAQLHKLIQQHRLGVPETRLRAMISDPELMLWWEHYLQYGPSDLPDMQHMEIVLSAPLAGYRVMAKYDLLAFDPGRRAVIVDWKTASTPPRYEDLAARLQTKVYPYVLAKSGRELNGDVPVQPDQIEMIYWFSNQPQSPVCFGYEADQYAMDESYLTSLVRQIEDLEEADFKRTSDERLCRYCVYRSLCERGERAGHLDAWENPDEDEGELDFNLDFGQIAEVDIS